LSPVRHGSPYKIGLTGIIGAGKSTVADVWKSLGAAIVEGDQMGRLALKNQSVIDDLTSRFGKDVIDFDDGTINRSELGRIAFSSTTGRKDLLSITFPELYRIAKQHFSSAVMQGKTVVFDAALIYEWGVEADFDSIVVVNALMDTAIQRSATKLNTSKEEIRNRLSAQISAEEKMRRADHVIDNDGNLDELVDKATLMWSKLEPQK